MKERGGENKHRQTDIYTHANGQTDSQAETGKQKSRQTETGKQANRQQYRKRQRHRVGRTNRHTDTQSSRNPSPMTRRTDTLLLIP